MDKMQITSAQYFQVEGVNDCIVAVIDGVNVSAPLVSGNRYFDEIMRQVEAGELTIADAD